MAVVCGACAGIAILTFQVGIRYGRISTSWLVINLSTIVPAILSLVVYEEWKAGIKWQQIAGLALVLCSVILLWRDKAVEIARSEAGGRRSPRLEVEPRDASRMSPPAMTASAHGGGVIMWYRMMVDRVLRQRPGGLRCAGAAGHGLGRDAQLSLPGVLVPAGLTVALIAFLSRQPKLARAEIAVGGLMGLFSSVGWILLTQAIARGMPGYLAFPIAIGGNLSIVAAVGVLVFKERLSPYGYLGILTGIAGIALLATRLDLD